MAAVVKLRMEKFFSDGDGVEPRRSDDLGAPRCRTCGLVLFVTYDKLTGRGEVRCKTSACGWCDVQWGTYQHLHRLEEYVAGRVPPDWPMNNGEHSVLVISCTSRCIGCGQVVTARFDVCDNFGEIRCPCGLVTLINGRQQFFAALDEMVVKPFEGGINIPCEHCVGKVIVGKWPAGKQTLFWCDTCNWTRVAVDSGDYHRIFDQMIGELCNRISGKRNQYPSLWPDELGIHYPSGGVTGDTLVGWSKQEIFESLKHMKALGEPERNLAIDKMEQNVSFQIPGPLYMVDGQLAKPSDFDDARRYSAFSLQQAFAGSLGVPWSPTFPDGFGHGLTISSGEITARQTSHTIDTEAGAAGDQLGPVLVDTGKLMHSIQPGMIVDLANEGRVDAEGVTPETEDDQ